MLAKTQHCFLERWKKTCASLVGLLPGTGFNLFVTWLGLANLLQVVIIASNGYWKNGAIGGQRQQVALARALLAKPKILVLDEATSSLDAQTEAGIWSSIRQLQGRYYIIVTHKLSSIKFADEIIVVKDRQIVERGSYDDLVSRDGDFKALSS